MMKQYTLDNGKRLYSFDPDELVTIKNNEVVTGEGIALGLHPEGKKIMIMLSGEDKLRQLGVFSKLTDEMIELYVYPGDKPVLATPGRYSRSLAYQKLKAVLKEGNAFLDPILMVSK